MFDYKNDPTLRALEGLLSTDDGYEPAEEGLKEIGAKFKSFVSGMKARATKNQLTKEEKAAIGNMSPQEAAEKYLATVSDMGSDTIVKEFIQWGKTDEAKMMGVTVKSFTYEGKTCALASVPTTASSVVTAGGTGYNAGAVKMSTSNITINLIYPGKEGATPTMRTIDVYSAAKKVASKDKKAANKEAARAAREARKNPTPDVAAASEALMNAKTSDEFLSAMESLTACVDDSIAYAMESFTKENLDNALKTFSDMVDAKCTTVTECETMASAIAGSSEKYNALLGAMKEGIEKAENGVIDKETLAKVLATAGAELKSLCNDCGLSGVSADDELSDEDITNLRALLLGAKQIVDQKTVALGGGSDEPTGPDGNPAQESLFDGLIRFGSDPAEEGFKEWREKRRAKKAAKKGEAASEEEDDDEEAEPAEESDVFTFGMDDDVSMESLFNMPLGDIAMEGDEGGEASSDTTVAAVKKNFIARFKEARANNKQIKSETRNLDMMTLVKEYLTKKTNEGLVLGTGSLLRKVKDSLKGENTDNMSDDERENYNFSVKEYRFNGKTVLIVSESGVGDALMYEVVTKNGYKAAVRTVFKNGLAKSVAKDRIKASKASESLDGLYAFLEDAQIATESNVCCADGNMATILMQKKISEMNFDIDDDGYTILINTPDEA